MELDTLPKILIDNYKKYGNKKVAMRRKDMGIWHDYTWQDYYEHVKYFGLGLYSLGFRRGDILTMIGDSAPELSWAQLGAQGVGGLITSIYPDCLPAEIKYFLGVTEAKFIVAGDEEQVDKVSSLKKEIPDMKKVIFWDPKGLWKHQDPLLMSLPEVEEVGRKCEKENPGLFEELVAKGKGDDIASIGFTSGTTGNPKGMMRTHKSAILEAEVTIEEEEKVKPFEDAVAGTGVSEIVIVKPLTLCFPEAPDTLQQDMREIGPRSVFFFSRAWEHMASLIQVKIAEGSPIKGFFYNLALKESYAFHRANEKKRKLTIWLLTPVHRLAHFLVFTPLKDKLGLSKVRSAVTAGSQIAPETIELFQNLGINLKDEYGASEMLFVAKHEEGDIRPGTVGRLRRGVEVKFTPEGEMLFKVPWIFSGYYKNPEATAAKFKDGWYCSGDAGHLNEEGHLVYWDRVGELMTLTDGTKFAPQFIESRLRFSPYVANAVVEGGAYPFVSVLINMNYANVSRWAEINKVSYTTYADLSQRPEVIALLLREVRRINRLLPATAKIKKFVSTAKEFDPDELELTRTSKLKRKLLTERYAQLIDGIYQGVASVELRTSVTYRDGRQGVVTAKVLINEVPEGEK